MPSVNPAVLTWARETARLRVDEAAKKLGIIDTVRASAEQKLTAYEEGDKKPSRAMLLSMSRVYRRPLLTFYLSEPPRQGDRGEDFRTLPDQFDDRQSALVDALIRDIRARQSSVREALIDADEAIRLDFIGSGSSEWGIKKFSDTLSQLLSLDLDEYRRGRTVQDSFKYLRERVEEIGIFVILKGNLGSYHSNIDVSAFRGFALSDDVAPFIVINDRDARSALSFTLLHEMCHLLLGQTGISGGYAGRQIEKFCNNAASQVLLPDTEFNDFQPLVSDFEQLVGVIAKYANSHKVSSSLVSYRLYSRGDINETQWGQLRDFFKTQWQKQQELTRERGREQGGGPSYYVVNRYKLGALVGLVHRLAASGTVTTTEAGMLLGVRPLKVYRMFENSQLI